MQRSQQLLVIANKIRKDKELNFNIDNIERYTIGFNL